MFATDPAELDELRHYDYELPAELIANRPLERRDDSRLMVVERASGRIAHHRVTDLPELLEPGDRLVLNDTRVIPARLIGRRTATGGRWEGLYLGETAGGDWRLIGQTRGKLRAGESLTLVATRPDAGEETLQLQLIERDEEGVWTARLARDATTLTLLDQFGTVPLPPYIQRERPTQEDFERYQTTYARVPGSIAAPTAGLHFTEELLAACEIRGIARSSVTLHVGLGTFRPVQAARLSEHRMHAEWGEVSAPTARELAATRATGGRLVAVGTTSVRTLETVLSQNSEFATWSGQTDLFIRPPHQLRAVDGMVTNFHLPRSTLFVLVCAVLGTELAQAAYREAVSNRYRFYSYGDAMLIL